MTVAKDALEIEEAKAEEARKLEEQRRGGLGYRFPTRIWLGMIRDQWPVHVFTTEDQAIRWATHGGETRLGGVITQPEDKEIIGPIEVPDLPVMKGRVEPATHRLVYRDQSPD